MLHEMAEIVTSPDEDAWQDGIYQEVMDKYNVFISNLVQIRKHWNLEYFFHRRIFERVFLNSSLLAADLEQCQECMCPDLVVSGPSVDVNSCIACILVFNCCTSLAGSPLRKGVVLEAENEGSTRI
jgi:hypothetical protein